MRGIQIPFATISSALDDLCDPENNLVNYFVEIDTQPIEKGESDQDYLFPLLDEYRQRFPDITVAYIISDKGYDSKKIHQKLFESYEIIPVIIKKLKPFRTAIERNYGLVKENRYRMENTNTHMGLDNVLTHVVEHDIALTQDIIFHV